MLSFGEEDNSQMLWAMFAKFMLTAIPNIRGGIPANTERMLVNILRVDGTVKGYVGMLTEKEKGYFIWTLWSIRFFHKFLHELTEQEVHNRLQSLRRDPNFHISLFGQHEMTKEIYLWAFGKHYVADEVKHEQIKAS